MATAADMKLMQDRQRSLRTYGIAYTPINNPAPKSQWWKSDGSPLPNLLPGDPYHIRLYEQRGWKMYPPQAAEVETVVPLPEPTITENHVHKYASVIGSPCKVMGCSATRQRAKARRRSRQS